MTAIRYFTKGELEEANRRAIKAGFRAVEATYLKQLPDACRYPVVFTLPWERHGWVRCQIGTARNKSAEQYTLIVLDVPHEIFENLASIEVPDNMEVRQ